MAQAKVCGITTPEALDAAITHGARFVGFVFYPRSPRHVSLDLAASLAARARGRTEIVALTVDANDSDLAAIARSIQPDWIQAHGAETPSRVSAVRSFAIKGAIKALGVARADDLAQAAVYEPVADMLLFDAKPPAGGVPGGNAVAFDWQIMAGKRFSRPWMLSGGLTPQNVREAIQISGTSLVDVSSGVEAERGLKDPSLIGQFLAAARA